MTQCRPVMLDRATTTADKIPYLAARHPLDRPLAVTLADHRQIRPLRLAPDALRLMDQLVNAFLLAAMTFLLDLVLFITQSLTVVVIRLDETVLNVRVQMLLVLFDRQ